jgi:hypothetical protein
MKSPVLCVLPSRNGQPDTPRTAFGNVWTSPSTVAHVQVSGQRLPCSLLTSFLPVASYYAYWQQAQLPSE